MAFMLNRHASAKLNFCSARTAILPLILYSHRMHKIVIRSFGTDLYSDDFRRSRNRSLYAKKMKYKIRFRVFHNLSLNLKN